MSSIFKWFKSADCSLENGGRFGPYRLHELVNEGGMAQLWLASNTREETFALRIALPSLSSINRKRYIPTVDENFALSNSVTLYSLCKDKRFDYNFVKWHGISYSPRPLIKF